MLDNVEASICSDVRARTIPQIPHIGQTPGEDVLVAACWDRNSSGNHITRFTSARPDGKGLVRLKRSVFVRQVTGARSRAVRGRPGSPIMTALI
jgi:hypothetical protein